MDTPSSSSVASLASSTSAVPLLSISSLLTTTASPRLHVLSSSLRPPVLMTNPTLSLHPQDAVATSPNLQQNSAVRQLTNEETTAPQTSAATSRWN